MKAIDTDITGVLHHQQHAHLYRLRRYSPCAALAPLVEQFWLVDWNLTGEITHVQQNLPDPNMHLIIDATGVHILGPVSKKYTFTMQNKSRVIGVKFNIGVLTTRLPCTILEAIDRRFEPAEVFPNASTRLPSLMHSQNDKITIEALSLFLQPYVSNNQPKIKQAQHIVHLIKTHTDITKVSILSEKSGIPVRTLQRLFKEYIGLSPKWLIRKYRLHYALALLSNSACSLTELANELDYTDQSHLIRDFMGFLNMTPSQCKEVIPINISENN